MVQHKIAINFFINCLELLLLLMLKKSLQFFKVINAKSEAKSSKIKVADNVTNISSQMTNPLNIR